MTPVPSLMKWGVTPRAELVYRTLLTLGPHRIADLHQALAVPGSALRSALDELYALGGAAPAQPHKTAEERIWSAVAPQSLLTALRDRWERSAQYQRAVLELVDGSGIPTPQVLEVSDTIRPLHGVASTRSRLAELTLSADFEFLSMSPQRTSLADSLRAAAPTGRAGIARGLAFRYLGVPALADNPAHDYGMEMQSYGARFRTLSMVPVKMMLIDRRTAILPLDPADLFKGAWEISTRSIVDDLVSFFLQRWERAQPLQEKWRPAIDLSPREREIISLIAEGLTDESVAARLGISRRSITYAITGLMERYHATNRFQLGLMLGAQAAQQSKEDEES